MAGQSQSANFPASDFPPMQVVVLEDKHNSRALGTTDVKAGQSGLYGGMETVTQQGQTLHKIVEIKPTQDHEALITDADNVEIHRGYPFIADKSTGPMRE